MTRYQNPEMWKNALTLNTSQAAKMLGVSLHSVRAGIKSGAIPSIRLSKKLIRVPKAKLMEMINNRE